MTNDSRDPLRSQIQAARAALAEHMASWEYAYAMGSSREGVDQHPQHRRTRAATARLLGRCRDLEARLAEYEL